MADPYADNGQDMSKLAYWIMRRAIERDPDSSWAREATEQWLRYCEQERRAVGQGGS